MASGEMSEGEFCAFLRDALGAAANVSRDGAVHFVCMDWRRMDDVSAIGQAVYGDLLNLTSGTSPMPAWGRYTDPSMSSSSSIGSDQPRISI